MVRPALALATSDENPLLFAEEQQLPHLFASRGIDATPVVWNDPSVRWAAFSHVVIRSTWDYFTRVNEFRGWLEQLETRGIQVHNGLTLLRWNLDKVYLAELEAQGISIIPTRMIRPGELVHLSDVLKQQGWQEAILKPSISAGSHRTHRLTKTSAAQLMPELQDILQSSAALVQEFCSEIQTQGEWSVFFFGGRFSHAVLKKPKANDFRSQSNFGAQSREAHPSVTALDAAHKILRALPEPPVYVRIDGIERQGTFQLMEVEAIEPYLYSAPSLNALTRYVDAITSVVRG